MARQRRQRSAPTRDFACMRGEKTRPRRKEQEKEKKGRGKNRIDKQLPPQEAEFESRAW
ncbi:Hypothetical predicted protein [Podarcis lilfordi]|uniref:Uncharacterized protein n=1 Tax=Podarcis lilfordi TaxID=74358 RepID=A0AA35KN29_9SAUR|nr:Hypothetical predicted protein [Podarcis lilfordi]